MHLGLLFLTLVAACNGHPRLKRAAGDCTVEGQVFSNGEIFTIPGKSKCIEHECKNGGYSLHKAACEVAGQCHDVGSVFMSSCTQYVCKLEGKYVYPEVKERLCPDSDGKCHEPGQQFAYVVHGKRHDDCTCSVEGNQLKYTCGGPPPSGDCTIGDQVVANGDIFTMDGKSPCIKFQCQNGGYTLYSLQCTDVNGQCHNLGSTFPFEINGEVHNDCTCNKEGSALRYSCPGTGSGGGSGGSGSGGSAGNGDCTVQGQVFSNGEIFTIPGSSKCVQYKCENGGYSLHKAACEVDGQCHDVDAVFMKGCTQYVCRFDGSSIYPEVSARLCPDADGKCHEPGQQFAYVVKGTRRDDCTCSVEGNRLKYSCGGSPNSGGPPPSGDCTIGSQVVANGDIFSIDGQSPCIKYKCQNGGYTVHSVECSDADGACHALGSTFARVYSGKRYEQCTCELTDNRLKYTCSG